MYSAHGRDFWAETAKPDGVCRILCLGDSMVWGFGCAPDQTLPTYVERYFNEAAIAPLVEVVNHGLCHFNLYNSWGLFKATVAPGQCDGVILVLCNNDVMALEATYEKSYRGGLVEEWSLGHPARDLIAASVRDIAAFVDRHDLPFLACLYETGHNDCRWVPLARELFAAAGLPVIDSLSVLDEPVSGLSLAERRASRIDTHPSPISHNLFARRIVDEASGRGFLRGSPLAATALPDAVSQALSDFSAAGAEPPQLWRWGREILRAKERAVHRRAAGELAVYRVRARQIETALAERYAEYEAASAAAAVADWLAERADDLSTWFRLAEQHLLRIEEAALLLNADAGQRAAEYLCETLPRDTLAPRAAAEPLRAATQRFAAIAERLAVIPSPLARHCTEMARRAMARLGMIGGSLSGAAAPRIAALLVEELNPLLESLREFPLPDQPQAADGALYTTIAVHLACAGMPSVFGQSMTMFAVYSRPQRLPVYDAAYLEAAPGRQSFTFAVPRLFSGRVRVSFYGGADQAFRDGAIAVTKVELYARADRRLSLSAEDLEREHAGYLSGPLLLI